MTDNHNKSMQTNTQSTEPEGSLQTTGESSLDGAACSPSVSDTPETDASVKIWRESETGQRNRMVPVGLSRRLERERNFWRNEHDRVVAEYQHRLTVLATSAITATHYPEENVQAVAPATLDTASPKDVMAG